MMDNSVCMALVPYEGSYRHASFLKRIFAKRRWLYFFLLPLTVASAFPVRIIMLSMSQTVFLFRLPIQ